MNSPEIFGTRRDQYLLLFQSFVAKATIIPALREAEIRRFQNSTKLSSLMVKPDVFLIVFDNPNRVYQPGQLLSGHIDLQLSKEKSTAGVFLTVCGGANAHWVETKNESYHDSVTNKDEIRSIKMHYRSSNVYFQISVMVWGNGNSLTMPAGSYNLPFVVTLPQFCLPSFQGRLGKIDYYCKAKIDRPWRFDHEVKEMFTLLPVYDLNLSPSAGLGMVDEIANLFGSFCCPGSVYYLMNVPKSGYVPGERIKVTFHINNCSNQAMQALTISLVQIAQYTAAPEGRGYQQTRRETRNISTLSENLQSKVAPSQYSISKLILIPPVVATTDDNYSIIRVHYELVSELVISEAILQRPSNRELRLPIIIGTVPFRLLPTASPVTAYQALGILQLSTSERSTATASVPIELSSPSYEECMFGKMGTHNEDDNKYTGGCSAFAPRYPVYRF